MTMKTPVEKAIALPPFFTDKYGRQTIVMAPNGRLLFIVVAMMAERFAQMEWHTWAQLLVLAAITMWASDEFMYGVSAFRKLLGFGFLLLVGFMLFKLSYRL